MKKILNFSFVLLAGLALSLACSKIEEAPSANEDINNPAEQGEQPEVKMVTISVSMPSEGLTKIAFEQDPDNKDGAVKLTWEEGDKILVNETEFTLVSGAGTQTAGFSGPEVTASSYTIAYNDGAFAATQTQAADADTKHLAYVVSLAGVNTYQEVEFTQDWATAHGGTLTQSGIFRLRAQMPAGVAAKVTAVKIEARDADDHAVNIFGGSNILQVDLTAAGDADGDGILDIYANLPTTAAAIPAGTAFFVRFKTNDRGPVWSYTRYHVFTSALELTPGKVNALKLNCTATDKHAGNKTVCDGTTAAKAYLIGDGYQLQALDGLLASKPAGTTVYAELIDDIDLSASTNWNAIDASTRFINLEGNNHKVSNLKITSPASYAGLFKILYGTVKNLTISDADVKGNGSNGSGILAGYLCSTTGAADCTIDNVNIEDSKLDGNGKVCGALASSIGQNASATYTISISNVTVSGTIVTTTNDCGGLIALVQGASSANRTVSISNCDIVNSTISVEGTGVRVGGLLGVVPSAHTTISDIDIKGTNVSGTNKAKAVGGIVGLVSNAADFDRCTFEKNGETPATVTGPTKHNNETNNASNDSDDKLAGGAYVGGIAGEVSGAASFDDCHVKNATVTITTPGSNTGYWKDLGGAFGYVHSNSATIGASTACSVEGTNVAGSHFAGGFVGFLEAGTISNATVTGLTLSGRNFVGGFVGQMKGGSIANSSVAGNSATAVLNTIGGFAGRVLDGTMDNNTTSLQMGTSSKQVATNAGGFAGQIWGGTIKDCTASGAVYSSANTVGGFVGNVTGGSFTSCSASGDVTVGATNNIGGFAGMVSAVNMTSCHASGSVSSEGTYIAGFIGRLIPGDAATATITSCYSTGSATSTSQQVGGFVGRVEGAGTSSFTSCYATGAASGANYVGGLIGYQTSTVTVRKCYATGNVTVASTGGGLIGRGGGDLTVENCYATGSVSGNNRRRGGILGWAEASSVSISNCYSTSNLSGTFEIGGVVGLANIAGVTVQNCAGWNGTITASSRASNNWSSAAIVGVSYLEGEYTNNYRSPSMDMTVYWGTNANCTVNLPTSFQHADVSSSNQLTDPNGTTVTSGTMRPYQGKCETGKTLSQLASTTLGWSSDIWDFTGELPTLK